MESVSNNRMTQGLEMEAQLVTPTGDWIASNECGRIRIAHLNNFELQERRRSVRRGAKRRAKWHERSDHSKKGFLNSLVGMLLASFAPALRQSHLCDSWARGNRAAKSPSIEKRSRTGRRLGR